MIWACLTISRKLGLAESHASPVVEGIDSEIERFKRWEGLKEIPD